MSGGGRPTRDGERPRTRRWVSCAECAQLVTLNNMSTHWKYRHPEQPGPRRFTELPSQPDGVTLVGEARARRAPDRLPAVVETPARTELPPLHADDLDDVVLAVVQQIAGPVGTFPVEHLPALFAWREATSVFLRAVSRE